MVKELNIPPLRDTSPAAIERWSRDVSTAFNEAIRNLTNPGFFTWDDGCLNIATSATVSSTDVTTFFFDSPVTGNGSLLVAGVGFQGAKLAINDVTLTTTLSNTDTTAEINYEAAVTNLTTGDNTFKIWDTGTAGGELRKLEVRGLDSGGWKGFGALANQGTLNADVQQFEVGDASKRRVGQGIAIAQANDGDSITFNPARGEIPGIVFVGGGAGQPTGTAETGSWYKEVKAENSSTSGFDLSAKFKIAASGPTNVTDTGATGGTTAWVIEKSATQEDNDNTYSLQFDVQVDQATTKRIEGEDVVLPKTVTIALDTRTTSGGAWTERATHTYQNEDTTAVKNFLDEVKDVVVDGLGADAAFRTRVKSGSGNLQAFDNVKYTHGGTGATTQSMTPGNGEQPITILISNGIEETVS
ncbi:hypothetical protein GWO43_16045 [candidate division KSB1 bacterium]|nr:hypothetical protein [candidate division KSB1 bacterium]NIV68744.1 hypothetical protein [Phycisphaerae bacterium]NIS25463.1 hypothetical protein [candidate division KSB1 bacterium]NIT72355.1 hypothetical protein [candidate division KSB1 bacterium]NIU26140.1 hypothetical protein [candidate division KSB1 bacterium]